MSHTNPLYWQFPTCSGYTSEGRQRTDGQTCFPSQHGIHRDIIASIRAYLFKRLQYSGNEPRGVALVRSNTAAKLSFLSKRVR